MALTVSSPHASGTVSSVSGNTITLATGTATANWVGRLFVLRRTITDRGGQWREITAVNSTTEIEVQYAWRNSLATSNVDYEFLPQNGDAFDISVTLDDIDDGINLIKDTDNSYRVVDALTLDGNVTLYDKSRSIDFGGNLGNYRATDNAGLILGNYTESNLGEKGCFIVADGAASTVSVNSGNNDGTVSGDFLLHSCLIAIGEGVGAYFTRVYRDNQQRARIVDCKITGDFGGRYQGDRSILLRPTFIDSQSSIGPFTTKAPMAISGATISDSLQAYYWNNTLGGSGEIVGLIARRISDRLIRVTDANANPNPTETLNLIDWDISEWDVNGVEPDFVFWDDTLDNSTINWIRTLQLSSSTGGGRIAIFNAASTEISNELSGDGSYVTVNLIERVFPGKNNARDTFAQGVQQGPFTGKLRQYGFIFLTQTFAGNEPQAFEWFKTPNPLVTAISLFNNKYKQLLKLSRLSCDS